MTFVHEHDQPIPAPPDRVYAVLTTPAELEQWFAEHVHMEPKVGGPFRFWGRHTIGTPKKVDAIGKVTALEPGTSIAWNWTLLGVPSHVSLTVAADGEGSKVHLRHELDRLPDGPRAKELVDDWWRFSLGNLMVYASGMGEVVRPDFADTKPEIRVSMSIQAPSSKVFRALIEPEQLRKWYMATDKAVVDPRVGGKFDMGAKYTYEGREMVAPAQTILEYVPNERLTIDWPDWRGDTSVPTQRVTWLLEPEGDGTRVTVIHTGFIRTVDFSDYPFGWGYFTMQLGKVAATL